MASCIPSPHHLSPHQQRWAIRPSNNEMKHREEETLKPLPIIAHQQSSGHRVHRHNASSTTSRAAAAFKQVKSPMSQCIDTIMSAAEVVAKREGEDPARAHSSYFEKPARRPPSKLYPEQPRSESVFMDPIEEMLEDDKALEKKLILTMALQRPRTPANPHPTKQPSQVIQEGFYWKEYPTLEDVLYEHMEEYYEWSTRERQSKHQQAFNNALVDKVRQVAIAEGYQFCPVHFTDKRLRDRIRCFYKTHLQNAKKRLHTMKKHLENQDHRQSLANLIDQAQTPTPFQQRLIPVVSNDDEEAVPTRKRQRSR